MYPARSSLREAAMRMVPPKLPAALYGARAKNIIRSGIRAATSLSATQKLIERTWGCVVILGKPKSRGRLSLGSHDAGAQALIDPGYFTHPEDMETMVKGVHLARRIASGSSLEVFGNLAVLPPSLVKSDSAIQRFIELNAMTTFHYAGTCRMGDDTDAVVDTELRVRGVTGLRVADASVVPFTPVSAMNAPSMMIGQRAVTFMRAELDQARGASSVREGERAPWPA
jgi:choline dehydrogenase